MALFISFIINVFVVSVFAHGMYGKTNKDIVNTCVDKPMYAEAIAVFGNNTEPVEADLYKGGIFLGCTFGAAALYIWAIGILSAGQSSTMTGTYAGQFAMEGFLNLTWARWKRVLFTRLIAIVPTFCVAFFNHIEDLTGMNDLLNAVMALQLPFAVIPTIAFTSSVAIMGEYVNGLPNKIVTCLLCVLVIAINIFFVTDQVQQGQLAWYWMTLVSKFRQNFMISRISFNFFFLSLVIFAVLYISFNIYLVIHMSANMGSRRLNDSPVRCRLLF